MNQSGSAHKVALYLAITWLVSNFGTAEGFLCPRGRDQISGLRGYEHVLALPPGRSTVSVTVVHEKNRDDEMVEVGSREYLGGFLSSPIQDKNVPLRGNGLEQALKLGVTVAVALIALFVGFMASNGLL